MLKALDHGAAEFTGRDSVWLHGNDTLMQSG
jgi:hypothetical protein